ncbi:uracil phosphoribosyltransferase-domain-containing protein [Circinella umbellata]|nr:uracil phosphoribosyltransferase-domain-containing protein [Circinella umbellata]
MTGPNLHISQHPIVAVKLSQLREVKQNSKAVRELMSELATLVGYEATLDIGVSKDKTLTSPYESFQGTELSQRVALVPILRSGLGLVDGFLTLFPEAPVLHLGLFREKVTLQPVEYYNKLPQTPNADICYVLDPVVATGNTAVATVNILKEWGIAGENIKFVGILASKQGITHLQEEHPDIKIYFAGVDDSLDENGYIRPGIGDSGDRLWNTAA